MRAPLDREEVAAVLASELAEAGSRVTGLGRKADALVYRGKWLVIEALASRLDLRDEFEAAVRGTEPKP